MSRGPLPIPADILAGLVSFVAYVALAARVKPDGDRALTSRSYRGAGGAPRKSHCIHGHEFAGANLHISPDGKKKCRACAAERWRAKRRRAADGSQ